MEERQVTLGDYTHPLDDPFMVLATQNPVEQEGTYPLPEAQLDRFMLKVIVGYPSRDDERLIIDRMAGAAPSLPQPVVSTEIIRRARHTVYSIYVDDKIKDYILDIVFMTRDPASGGMRELVPLIEIGASPRATIALTKAAKAAAFIRGRSYVTPDDVKQIVMDVLRHRLLVSFEAEAESITPENIIQQIIGRVEVP